MNRFHKFLQAIIFLALLITFISAANAQTNKSPETLNVCDFGTNVEVEGTGGTNAGYATLGAAFAAINAGTHTGNINVEICANTNEGTTPATLNSSGAGAASYTVVSVYPLQDNITVTGAPGEGFGVIQLNGADNVQIQGDSTQSPGPNQDLTVINSSAPAVILSSVIRVATSPGTPSADNISILNTKMLGNVTNRNNPLYTDLSDPSNLSYGVYVGGNGGASATDAPAPISGFEEPLMDGTTVNNFLVNLSSINQCAQGVHFNGDNPTTSNNVTIQNNAIGDQTSVPGPAGGPYTTPVTSVYSKGIAIGGVTSVLIDRNSIKNIVSYTNAGNSGVDIGSGGGAANVTVVGNSISNIFNNQGAYGSAGIRIYRADTTFRIQRNSIIGVEGLGTQEVGGILATVYSQDPNNIIERNIIRGIYNRSTGTAGPRGIHLTYGYNTIIRNNMISDLKLNATGGNAFSGSYALFGLLLEGSNGVKVYNNSISLTGALLGSNGSLILTAAFGIFSGENVDVRNNIFANRLTGGNNQIAHTSMFLSAGTSIAENLTLNNNLYFSGTDPLRHSLAQIGFNPGSNFYLQSDFNPNNTTNPLNFRTFSATLTSAGTNDRASLAGNPNFVNPVNNLHIPADSYLIDSGAAAVRTLQDIDGEVRTATPDIGADEATGVGPFFNDIAANDFVSPMRNQRFNGDTTITPQATFQNLGTGTSGSFDVRFRITGPGGFTYADTQTVQFVPTGDTVTVTFAATPVITGSGVFTMTAEVITADQFADDDSITSSFTVAHPLSGTYNIPGDFDSLTNAGGLFDMLNFAGTSANVTVNITADISYETGAIALNQITGGHSVFIHASGAPRVIEGDAENGLIRLDGADNVIFDGAPQGNPRGLTIRNYSSVSGQVFLLTNDASNNAIINCNIEQNSTSAGFQISFGNTLGNLNNSINGSRISGVNATTRMFYGVLVNGGSTIVPNSGISITDSEIVDFRDSGIAMAGGAANVTITGNQIYNLAAHTTALTAINMIQSAGTNLIARNEAYAFETSVNAGTNPAVTFIYLGSVANMTVTQNRMHAPRIRQGASGAVTGIRFDGGAGTNSSAVITNNMIDLMSYTDPTSSRYVGLMDNSHAGNTVSFVNNTVLLAGESGNQPSWAFLRSTSENTNLTLRNNILTNCRYNGGVNHFGGGDHAAGAPDFDTNENIFVGTGLALDRYMDIGTDPDGTVATPNEWVNGPPQRDTLSAFVRASNFSFNNVFVAPFTGDLHLIPSAGPLILNAGGAQSSPTVDIDGDPRNVPAVDVDRGADELVKTHGVPMPAGNYYNVMFVPGDQFGGDIGVRRYLYLNGATSPTNSDFVIDMGCQAAPVNAGEGSYIAGKVRYQICQQSLLNFPVGAGSGYSPVAVLTETGTVYPATMTVNAVDDFLPGLLQVNGVSRYFTIEKTGTVNVDMFLNYRSEDVNGDEANYKAFRRSGGVTTAYMPSTVDAANNYVYVENVTNFSEWGIGALAPTAASVDLSGTVRSAEGRPIRNVIVTLSGSSLTEPRYAQTGNLGMYQFTDLTVGTFVVTINAKRFVFNVPSQLINLSQDVNNVDFTASPVPE